MIPITEHNFAYFHSFFLQVKYKEEFEKNRGQGFTEIPETSEMALSKELRPIQSRKLYAEKSKDLQKNVSINAGDIMMLSMQLFSVL